jgi:hypothetical protein
VRHSATDVTTTLLSRNATRSVFVLYFQPQITARICASGHAYVANQIWLRRGTVFSRSVSPDGHSPGPIRNGRSDMVR